MKDSGYKELKDAAVDFVNSECHQILLSISDKLLLELKVIS